MTEKCVDCKFFPGIHSMCLESGRFVPLDNYPACYCFREKLPTIEELKNSEPESEGMFF